MKRNLILVFVLASMICRAGITIETVTVGDPGNPPNPADSHGRGAVSNSFKIAKYEVTIAQYAAFLNAVAQTDTYNLYISYMGSRSNVAGIARSGSSGSRTYSVKNNFGSSSNRPITYISWFDAARFANWMANGQPAGAQDATTTEDGAYTLNGATNGNLSITRNVINPNTGRPVAWWIPSSDEWYKAAYYKGSGDAYWLYPTQSDEEPGNVPGETNAANYRLNGGTWSLTQSTSYSFTQNYLTDVGAFDAPSHYGTYGQAATVREWVDTVILGNARGRYGSSWDNYITDMISTYRGSYFPETENASTGFRLASAMVIDIPGVQTNHIWLEAENGIVSNDWLIITGETDTSGGDYVSTTNNVGTNYTTAGDPDAGTCTLQFTSSNDTYAIWMRVITPTTSDDSFHVKVDGESYAMWDCNETTTWGWQKWAEKTMAAGTHTLTICQREDGAKIDKVLITDDLSYTPTGQGGSEPEPGADTDSDGIADSWELVHFGNLTTADGSSDQDADGQLDLAEYIAGTQPTNALSVFEIDAVEQVIGDAGTAIRWIVHNTNAQYTVMWATNIVDEMQALGAPLIPGGEEELPLAITDTVHSAVQEIYYRLKVEPAP